MGKVIFITGASKGFGKLWASAALQQGYKVVATARNIDTLHDLVTTYGANVLALTLDVTNRAHCFSAVEKAQQHFGSIDILINNAGYGHIAMIEEISEQEIRQQMDTNYFGSLWMLQAVLPIMRQQQSGHIIQLSSLAGVVAFPSGGHYNASKWAIEASCDAMSQEVAAFGIKVTIVEPTGYATDFSGGSLAVSQPLPAYHALATQMKEYVATRPQLDPTHTWGVIQELINLPQPPLRLFFGADNLNFAGTVIKQRLATWEQYQHLATKAQ